MSNDPDLIVSPEHVCPDPGLRPDRPGRGMNGLCACGCGGTTPIASMTNRRKGHVAGQPVRYMRGHVAHRPRPVPIEDRFWRHVQINDPEDCWPWTGTCTDAGYGQTTIGRRTHMAHRVSYELAHGPIPSGLIVRHACDNPPCVNPAHLTVGTYLDNMRDAQQRNRTAKGSRNGGAKLTEAQVWEIRQLRAQGLLQREIAELYGVNVSTIRRIDSGRHWSHVAGVA